MEEGWRTPFSLALVELRFLTRVDAAQYAKIAIGLASGSKTADKLSYMNTAIKVKPEEDMSFEEWRYAYDNLMLLIERYRSPNSLAAWEKHWYMVYSHRNVRDKWHRLMRYDIKICQMATQVHFDMGIWQQRIYDEIVDQDRDDIAARKHTHTFPSLTSTAHKSGGDAATSQKRQKIACGPDPRERCFRCGLQGDH
ncbi:hypothetical protein FRC08_006010 [Ceratobasidium sp. 394]|nr:hypothetical protein FRC08_006010 [Ceratobasidium sp. 394]